MTTHTSGSLIFVTVGCLLFIDRHTVLCHIVLKDDFTYDVIQKSVHDRRFISLAAQVLYLTFIILL